MDDNAEDLANGGSNRNTTTSLGCQTKHRRFTWLNASTHHHSGDSNRTIRRRWLPLARIHQPESLLLSIDSGRPNFVHLYRTVSSYAIFIVRYFITSAVQKTKIPFCSTLKKFSHQNVYRAVSSSAIFILYNFISLQQLNTRNIFFLSQLRQFNMKDRIY